MSGLLVIIFDRTEVHIRNHADSEPDMWGSHLVDNIQNVIKTVRESMERKVEEINDDIIINVLKCSFNKLKVVDCESDPPKRKEIEKLKGYSGEEINDDNSYLKNGGEITWQILLGNFADNFDKILECGYIYDEEYQYVDYEYVFDMDINRFLLNDIDLGLLTNIRSDWEEYYEEKSVIEVEDHMDLY